MRLFASGLSLGSPGLNRLESILIGLFVGIACPYLAFIAFWWATVVFHFYIFPLPTGVIAAVALAGLGLGCWLDVVFLRRWVGMFYIASLRWMLVLYLGCFVVGFASFMGFPFGTFALGLFAGAYSGRRERYRRSSPTQLKTTLSRTALLTSSLTAAAALPIGILGLREPAVGTWIQECSGLDCRWLEGTAGYALVGLFCLLLFAAQYWGSRKIGVLAFDLGPNARPHISRRPG